MARIIAGDAALRLIGQSLTPPLRAIAASLGPSGRVSLHEGAQGSVADARTGVAIARAISCDEGPWSVAPRLLKETLVEAERDLGDGTARLAVIMGATLRAGLRLVAAGFPPGALADGILAALPRVRADIARQRIDEPDLVQVAAGAGADGALAAALSDATRNVGPTGIIDIVAGTRQGLETRLGEGFILEGEAITPDFAPQGAEAISFDPVHVLVADEMIEDFGPLVPILEGFAMRGKALAVIARDIRGAALATLVRNKRDNYLRIMAMRPQAVAQAAADGLEDLAIATGATLIADRFGTSIAGLRPSHLGRAGAFRFTRNRAIFAQPAGDAAAVSARATWLAAAAEKATYLALDRERLARRRARLLGRWGEIELAGASARQTEALATTARATLAALFSAQEGGAVAGGGLALTEIAARFDPASGDGAASAEDAARICIRAGLGEVGRQLARHAGGDRGPAAPEAAACPLDPLPMTQAIAERALSLAATLIRIDILICS